MIKFVKKRFLAILFLSVIFTFSSLFWINDTVYNQKDLSSIELGWPANFVSQNKAFSLTPPESWFPKKVGFGLPQEYPISIDFSVFLFDVVFSFIVIFLLVFVILKIYPNSKVLSKFIKARYIVGFISLVFMLFIFYIIFSSNINQLQMGVGIPPPTTEKPIPQELGYDINISPNQLSTILEVMYRFDKNKNILQYRVIEKSNMWWNTNDGCSC
jgi:hypothetical protein